MRQGGWVCSPTMPVSNRMRTSLVALVNRLTTCEIPYALGGSMMLHLRGLTDDVADIDIAVPADAKEAVRAATQAWWIGERPNDRSTFDSAWRVKLDVDGVAGHVFGGFAVMRDERRVALPLRSDEAVEIDGTAVSLAPLEVWWLAYGAYRPERAEAIAQTIERSRCTALLEELELT